ncbi:GIY-YIG nuclease family protein [Elusimicrobiota bacterium]
MHDKNFFVYVLSNKGNTTLYIGVTNNLERRMWEHKNGEAEGFSKKYPLTKLLHYEETVNIDAAITREKQLKNWHRNWKVNLIKAKNPDFKDLAGDWLK